MNYYIFKFEGSTNRRMRKKQIFCLFRKRGKKNSTIICVYCSTVSVVEHDFWWVFCEDQEVCTSTYVPPKYADTFKLWISITAGYSWKIKKTDLYPLSQSSYWQSWKHNQGLRHVWSVQLSSFTRSILKGITDVRMTQPLPKAAFINASGLICHPAHVEIDLGIEFCLPLTQRPRSPSLGPLFSLALEGTGWKRTFGVKECVTRLLAAAHQSSSQNSYSGDLESNPHPAEIRVSPLPPADLSSI